MRYLFNIENLVLPRVAGSSKGQSKIPTCGGQSSMALPVKIGVFMEVSGVGKKT